MLPSQQTWLIRHGESTINAGTWTAAPHAALLTAKGQQQAEAVAAQITMRPDLIVVSSAKRSIATAVAILKRWHDVLVETWDIQELTYLTPTRCHHLTLTERRQIITEYWQKADPFFCDGDEAESFADFMQRVHTFHLALQKQTGFVVVVGHGQFFKAYELGVLEGFTITSEWMQRFRNFESSNPIKNGEIIKIFA